MANSKRTTDFYRKKTHQLAQEVIKLRTASAQVGEIVDGILVQVAKRYGEEVKDEETGELIGYRLKIATPDRDGCEVRANSEEGEYTIGIILPMQEGK